VHAFAAAPCTRVHADGTHGPQEIYARAGGVADESLSSIRTVAAFGVQSKELRRYEAHLDEVAKAGIYKGLFQGVSTGNAHLVRAARSLPRGPRCTRCCRSSSPRMACASGSAAGSCRTTSPTPTRATLTSPATCWCVPQTAPRVRAAPQATHTRGEPAQTVFFAVLSEIARSMLAERSSDRRRLVSPAQWAP
jgi:hypothetical protein